MIRQLYTLGGLLALALVLSFVSATRQTSSSAAGKVRLVDASEEAFEALRWIASDSTVELTANDDRHGRWYQVTVRKQEEAHREQIPVEAEADASEAELPEPEAANTPDDANPIESTPEHEEALGENGPIEVEETVADTTGEPDAGEDVDETEAEDIAEGGGDTPAAPIDTPAPPSTPAEETVNRLVSFTGGIQALRLIEAVTPLTAARSIERVPAERLEAMGFGNGESRLEIVVRGRTHVFELGGRTYGGGHQYLRRPGETTVHLVEATPLRPLEHGARRLMRREIIEVRRNEIERLTLESGDGRRVEMIHRGREAEGPRSFFADASDPDRRVEEYGNWIGKVLALRVFDYVADDAVPQDLEPVLLLSFQAEGRSESIDLEIHRHVDRSGEETWYARSDHTRFVVSLPRAAAASVAADVDGILGG